MIDEKSKKLFSVIFVYFLLYLTAIMMHSSLWSDLLSPLGACITLAILFKTYRKSNRSFQIQKNWLLLAAGCFFWILADSLWAFWDLVLLLDPNESVLISVSYLLTNILFAASVIVFSIYKFKKWNALQLLIDSLAITVSIILFFWIIFLDKDFSIISVNTIGWIAALSIATDLIALVGISIWLYSIKSGSVPLYFRIIVYAILLFFLTDLYWFYLEVNALYIPNSLIDSIYIAAILGLAFGARFFTVTKNNPGLHDTFYSNLGSKRNSVFILLGLLIMVYLKGFVLSDVLNFLLIILIYESITINIQSAIREHSINLDLERKIEERTRELVEINQKLDCLSKQDTVTSLFNRRYFTDALEEKVSCLSSGEALALLYIDIDRFKTINDTFGHSVGDQVLVELSKRLLDYRPENAIISRLGGDEFVIAMQSDFGYRKIEQVARQIIDICNETIIIEQYSFRLTVSIGISLYPLDAGSAKMLLKNADMAMYQAKRRGTNSFLSFNQELNDSVQRKNMIEILLKQADFDKEFMLFYQPQFRFSDNRLIGMEALLRWDRPGVGFIQPGEFIPIAEEADCIIPIGDWVIHNAMRQIEQWNRLYKKDLKISINVSPRQLDQTHFIRNLQDTMLAYSVKPGWIDLEITEGVAMKEHLHFSEIATQLQYNGITISIDDFGTGYASLNHLKLFPYERIKIAKELIDTITNDNYDMQITKYIILLAKSMGIATIAEGVETKEQFDILSGLGCEQIQGFYLGKPVKADIFEACFLKED